MISDLATDAGSSFIGFEQAGTGAVTRSVQDKARETVSVLDFGADPTGVADSTTSFINAGNKIQAAGGGKLLIPRGVYIIYVNGQTYSQYPLVFNGINGIVVDFSEATIKVDPAKNWTGQTAAFCQFTNCNDIHVIGGYFESPAIALNGTFSGVEVVSLRGDCDGVAIPYLRVKNVLAALQASVPNTTAGSRNIVIGTIEATGCIYGVNCSNSGSNMVINNLVTDGCGRSYFVYGISHTKVNIRSKNFKFSADASISTISNGYNVIYDHEINYLNNSSSSSASVGVGVLVAHSFIEGVAGNISNVRVNIQMNLDGTGAGSAFEYTKYDTSGNPDPLDRGHVLTGLKVSGIVYGTPSFGAAIQFGQNGTVFGSGDTISQINVEDVRVLYNTSESISIQRVLPSLKGNFYLNKIQAITNINTLGGSNPATYTSTDENARLFVSDVVCKNIDSYDAVAGVNGVKTFVANTSPVTVRQQYSNLTLTNQYSGGPIDYNLPLATVGLQFSFAQVSANPMYIFPNGTDFIRGGGAGKYLALVDTGTSVTIFCRSSGIWEIIQVNGTTSFQP